jgi:hypothetical protein
VAGLEFLQHLPSPKTLPLFTKLLDGGDLISLRGLVGETNYANVPPQGLRIFSFSFYIENFLVEYKDLFSFDTTIRGGSVPFIEFLFFLLITLVCPLTFFIYPLTAFSKVGPFLRMPVIFLGV